jgi:colanic acid/amylovoran biosynthesis glycosyltransferase
VLTVAYLANQFPSPVEPYVLDEIEELRSRGVRVIAGSVRTPIGPPTVSAAPPEIVLQSISLLVLLQGAWLCLRNWNRISKLIFRILFRGSENPIQRLKALLHTWLGGCYAVLLQSRRVDHIHAHHGYFGSWIGMVAARLLDVGFSFTLHGSDLLLHAAYLDLKLESCSFCLTISEFNRRYILCHHPQIAARKVVVSRLGVEVNQRFPLTPSRLGSGGRLNLLAVGRLHAVKDHAFLLRACAELQARGMDFDCSIAGDGPERERLQKQMRQCHLQDRVTLLGHVPRQQMNSLYDRADIVVLTSRSEGLPLVLMEAMARGKIVLAPAITAIPELVIPGKTGFLYQPGSLPAFIDQLLSIASRIGKQSNSNGVSAAQTLAWICLAARAQVGHNFNRKKNLQSFADSFLARIVPANQRSSPCESCTAINTTIPSAEPKFTSSNSCN